MSSTIRLAANCLILLIAAFSSLAGCRRAQPDSTESLIRALDGGRLDTRLRAARRLGGRGAVCAEAVPSLLRAARDDHRDLRLAAVKALAVVDEGHDTVAVELLQIHASEADPLVRTAIEQAVAALSNRIADPWAVPDDGADAGIAEWGD